VGEQGPEAEQILSGSRARVALAAAVLLAGIIAAVVIASSSGSSEEGVPQDCLEAWNSDVEALNFGVHSSISHGYDEVQVGYLPTEGSAALSTDPRVGECAVVFAATEPDPELQSRGQIHREDGWVPLSRLLGPGDSADLQRAAVAQANATVTEYGKLIEAPPR
jgi:hypothetical protein